jgi:plastocyanin
MRSILAGLLLQACVIEQGLPAKDVPYDPADYADTDIDTANGGEAVVVMQGIAFDKQTVTVTPGSTVTWINQDTAFHIIAAGTPDDSDPPAWVSPAIQFGESWSRTFTEPGEHVYYCDNHERVMRDAFVVVQP